jgi:hypothetical protein
VNLSNGKVELSGEHRWAFDQLLAFTASRQEEGGSGSKLDVPVRILLRIGHRQALRNQ